VETFISTVIKSDKLAGTDPCSYWKTVDFLRIQQGGASQEELLALFDQVLGRDCGIQTGDCGDGSGPYVYLDDGIFSGNRLKNDLIPWIEAVAPPSCTIEVVVVAVQAGGEWYAERAIQKAAAEAHKTLKFRLWRCITYEDRKTYISDADVLRPAFLPDDAGVGEYVATLTAANWPPILRTGTNLGRKKLFSSAEGRSVLEQQLLVAGVRIRDMCPNLKENHHPLGYSVLRTLGFGALVVTFRNCPNNCPLAFWADWPWEPLFPRKNND
jgi:hypothetical protein